MEKQQCSTLSKLLNALGNMVASAEIVEGAHRMRGQPYHNSALDHARSVLNEVFVEGCVGCSEMDQIWARIGRLQASLRWALHSINPMAAAYVIVNEDTVVLEIRAPVAGRDLCMRRALSFAQLRDAHADAFRDGIIGMLAEFSLEMAKVSVSEAL